MSLKNFRTHYKNQKPYRINAEVLHSEDLSAFIYYECLYKNKVSSHWVRPKAMFEETVQTEHGSQPRFQSYSSIYDVPMQAIELIELPHFESLNYLKMGTPTQQKVFQELQESCLFDSLRDFSPVLAGTFPLGIEVAGSDLDILVQACGPQDVLDRLSTLFGKLCAFQTQPSNSWTIEIKRHAKIPIEIYIEDLNPREQRGFRHMLAEARLLKMGGAEATHQVRELKRSGLKTEPAFKEVFQLRGDPYMELLKWTPSSKQA